MWNRIWERIHPQKYRKIYPDLINEIESAYKCTDDVILFLNHIISTFLKKDNNVILDNSKDYKE